MEKRRKKTLARTLICATSCAKLLTVVALFAPSLLSFQQIFSPPEKLAPAARTTVVEPAPKPGSRDLVRVYSIVKGHRPEIAETEAWRIAETILEESSKRKLDALLISAVIQVESGFQDSAVSPSGARGLMQIMPETGRALTRALRHEMGVRAAAFKPEWLDNPFVNIRLGVYYLHDLKKQFRDLNLALTAYNFGPAEIQNRLENNLELSSEYAGNVLQAYRNLKSKHPSF
jgi:soluble lytic murein transglycosylase-like protein